MSSEPSRASDGGDAQRAASPEEPTVVDARPGSGGSKGGSTATLPAVLSDPGASGPSGFLELSSDRTPDLSTPGSASGVSGLTSAARTISGVSSVTTASPLILRAEEQARTVALMRLVMAVAVAGIIAVWLPRKDAPGRWLSTIVVAFTFFVSLWQVLELRDVARFDRRKVLFHGLCCVASILSVAYYVGVFSPAIIAMYVGIYFFGLSDSSLSGWVIYGTGAAGYLALNVLAMVGVIPLTSSVVPLGGTELPALVAITLVCQVLFATTFWMARRSRAATLSAFERLERATRQIRQRDALLDEARADLDRERAAKVGRYTDQQIGRYSVAEVIGRGAMGEVYRGIQLDTDLPVAIKFLSPALTEDAASVERFFREAEVAGRIDSEHIVRVLDRGIAEGGAPFLVMELLHGFDLAHHLREKKRFGMGATIELVDQIARGLAAADEAGIVHRDLKPQNLFSSESPGRRTWKILDFGVSKILESSKDLTMGAAVGTPSYMAPEQARGESVDHRADVFALGIVTYRVITGRPAFTAPDSAGTLYNVVQVQPVRPGDLVRIPEDVERVLAIALAKERERRFSSSLMFATALREAARQRLDERLRRDADAILAEHPWGTDLLQVMKSRAKRQMLVSRGQDQ